MGKKKKRTVGRKPLITVGIDPSINGTAITEFHNNELKNFWFFTEVKKQKDLKGAIYITKYDSQLAQIYHRVKAVTHIIDSIPRIDYIAIEDYAFGARGRVFHIGGFVEGIKMHIFEKQIPLRLYDPTTVKLFTTKNGNANKPAMALNVYKRWGEDFSSYGDAAENIVDAFAINKLLNLELKVKENPDFVKTLNKTERHIFEKTTKSEKVPLKDRKFIIKNDS